MNKQQKFLHAVSLLVTAFVIVCFFLLGGGTAQKPTIPLEQAQHGINVSVPEADANELSANRLEAVLRQTEENSSNERINRMQQASSFRWLDTPPTDSLPKHDEVAVQVEPTKAPSSQRAVPKKTSAQLTPEQEKQQFIAATRRQLAQKYGIELPEESEPTPASNPQQQPSATVASTSTPGFYGLESPAPAATDIRAVVHGEHRNVERGAIVKLRLLDNIVINGTTIPANTFLYGQLGFASCRATIRIENVQYGGVVYPFVGTIYDKDGFEGLYVPDNRIDEAARKAGSQALGNVNVRIPGASFITSASNAVVSAVQSVAQQTISEQKINISSNYLVTIKQTSK